MGDWMPHQDVILFDSPLFIVILSGKNNSNPLTPMTESTIRTKRGAFRFSIPAKKISYMANGSLGKANLADISSGGCAVTHCSNNVSVNDPVLIVLELSGLNKPLELKSKIIRSGDGTFSAIFTEIDTLLQKQLPTLLASERRLSSTD